MMIISLYSRLRQMTTPAYLFTLYMNTEKLDPSVEPLLISTPAHCQIQMSQRLLSGVPVTAHYFHLLVSLLLLSFVEI